MMNQYDQYQQQFFEKFVFLELSLSIPELVDKASPLCNCGKLST